MTAAATATASDVRALLARRQKVERQVEAIEGQLQLTLRALPRGQERRAAIHECISAGITRGELGRMLGVSRQRVHQLMRGENA